MNAEEGHRLFRYAAVLAFVATYVTILLGGNVMASDSGLACPDWPTCHGTFLPPLAGATGIEWAHRLSAFALSVIVLVLAVAGLLFERRRPVLRHLALASLAAVVAQALLGGLVVESGLTIGLVLLHLGLATLLFGLLLVAAFLANLREVPRRWVAWAQRAAEELPARGDAPPWEPLEPVPAPVPTVPDGPRP